MNLSLQSDQNKIISAQIEKVKIPSQIRLKNGCKDFFLFFIFAIVSIAIPVLHFILVPLFLILSVFKFFKGYSKKYQYYPNPLLPLTCVVCNKPLILNLVLQENELIKCPECMAKYILTKP
ncbi:MAG: hypothetical protein ACK41T_12075 [Pseudobdellovibrio sp.]